MNCDASQHAVHVAARHVGLALARDGATDLAEPDGEPPRGHAGLRGGSTSSVMRRVGYFLRFASM